MCEAMVLSLIHFPCGPWLHSVVSCVSCVHTYTHTHTHTRTHTHTHTHTTHTHIHTHTHTHIHTGSEWAHRGSGCCQKDEFLWKTSTRGAYTIRPSVPPPSLTYLCLSPSLPPSLPPFLPPSRNGKIFSGR